MQIPSEHLGRIQPAGEERKKICGKKKMENDVVSSAPEPRLGVANNAKKKMKLHNERDTLILALRAPELRHT